ncbi:hypothetical protein EAG_13317, partial [Camponotus floridanus]
NPAAFLERLTELRDNYQIMAEQILRDLSELLRGDALLWYRNHRGSWLTWQDFEAAFRLQFLPYRYIASLREIENRHQGANETFAQYSTVMMTLMRRLGGFSSSEQLEYLYNHMHPEYKFYIRSADFGSIAELQ